MRIVLKYKVSHVTEELDVFMHVLWLRELELKVGNHRATISIQQLSNHRCDLTP